MQPADRRVYFGALGDVEFIGCRQTKKGARVLFLRVKHPSE
jgi:hypothetical protein